MRNANDDGLLVVRLVEIEDQNPYSTPANLLGWLKSHDTLRASKISVAPGPPPAEEAMSGAVQSALEIAVAPGGAVAVLAAALTTWIKLKKRVVRIKGKDSEGRDFEVSIDGGRSDEVEIMAAIQTAFRSKETTA